MAFGGMWLASFFQGLSTGFWLPALTNILNAKGMGEWVGWAFAVPPVCALFSPLIGGALADERVSAQKLFAWCSLTGAVMLFLAFGALDAGFGPVWFLFFLAGYSIVSGPTWGLLATISMTHLGEGGRRYPLVRVGATIGWIVAGFLTSYALRADTSPAAGYAGAIARIACGIIAFTLPHTPPLGLGKSWKSALGLGAFSLFKHRDHAVLFTVTGLFSVPLVAFYMYSPELFEALGVLLPAASLDGLTVGTDKERGFQLHGQISPENPSFVGTGAFRAALCDERICRAEWNHRMAHRWRRTARGLLHDLFCHRSGLSRQAG